MEVVMQFPTVSSSFSFGIDSNNGHKLEGDL